MASADSPRSRETSRSGRLSKPIPSAIFHIDIAEAANRRRQALPLRRHRPHQQVRLHCSCTSKQPRAPQLDLPARPRQGGTLQDPHGAHRQRHPLHRSHGRLTQIRQMIGKELFELTLSIYACLADIDHRLTKLKASLDQWPGRTHEPHHQGRHRPRYHYDATRPVQQPTSLTSSSLHLRSNASRPSKASHHTNSSAKPGQTSQSGSPSTHSIKCRD